jgi:hypothetical protein
MYAVYIVSSYFYCKDNASSHADASYETFRDVTYRNLFHIGGISGAHDVLWLLWLVMGVFVVACIFWIVLVWLQCDPGIINSRDQDFEEVLAQSLLCNGPPPSNGYCRTTLVKKPLRSKYCTKTCAVVARMDHYCGWLNVTVGFKNHRSFFILLVSHLLVSMLGVILTVR